MKLIFLDHQGVMRLIPHPCPGTLIGGEFDTTCINILNDILRSDDDIQIVISSDWKYWVSLKEMQEFYKTQGIIRVPIAYTHKSYSIHRELEINEYINNAENITNWVCIDDIDLRNTVANFIWVSNPLLGLKTPGISDQLIKFLI
jgi:hypothetical protein